MTEKDKAPWTALPLGDRTAKYLAKDSHSFKWLFAIVIIGGITIYSAVSLVYQELRAETCDNHAYLNCTPKYHSLSAESSNRELGEKYLRLGRYQEAARELDEAVRQDASDYQSLFNRAEAYFNLGKIDLADRDYETLAESSPFALQAYSKRAAMYYEIQDYSRAIIEITHAIDLSPDDSRLLLQRAAFYIVRGDLDLALSDINPVLKLHPDDFEALGLRGGAQLYAGHYAEALNDFDQAIHSAPKDEPHPEIWHGRAMATLGTKRALSGDELRQVLADMKTASDQAKLEGNWQNTICYDLAIFGHPAEALAYCDLGISLTPDDSQIRDSRAYVYSRLGRWAEAVSDWDIALELSPDTAMFLFGRGFAREQLNKTTASLADYAAARALDQEIDSSMREIGIVPGTNSIPKGPMAWH